MAARSAVNRKVAGSSPAGGANIFLTSLQLLPLTFFANLLFNESEMDVFNGIRKYIKTGI
jgi:hypothetical protein